MGRKKAGLLEYFDLDKNPDFKNYNHDWMRRFSTYEVEKIKFFAVYTKMRWHNFEELDFVYSQVLGVRKILPPRNKMLGIEIKIRDYFARRPRRSEEHTV